VLVKEYRWDKVALMLADVARLKPQATTG
jgi:hypothetical protein